MLGQAFFLILNSVNIVSSFFLFLFLISALTATASSVSFSDPFPCIAPPPMLCRLYSTSQHSPLTSLWDFSAYISSRAFNSGCFKLNSGSSPNLLSQISSFGGLIIPLISMKSKVLSPYLQSVCQFCNIILALKSIFSPPPLVGT